MNTTTTIEEMIDSIAAVCNDLGLRGGYTPEDREAMLLWREPVVCVDETEVASSRYLELWLLEDMSVAVVSCVQIVFCDGNDYITEYREYKGDEIPFSEPVPDLLDFVDRLESLCPDEYHPDEVVIYET